ncbi:MAG: ATP-binding protein [Pyrinomonadaceae bacterium]
MSFRLALAILLAAGLLFASASFTSWSPAGAAGALGCALAGFLVARHFPRGARTLASSSSIAAASARPLNDASRERSGTTSDSASVESSDVPAGALLEVTMESMREGVLVVDSRMRVVASNNAARDIFNTGSVAALQSRRLSELTRNPAIYSAFAAAVARGERAEVKVETAEADRRAYDLHVAPLRQKGIEPYREIRGAVGVFFDITRLERLERVRQEFLSNVSHELRTPLTAILAFVETLEEGALDEPETARRFLSIIRRNSERMRDLINDILELSAIEAGTVSVEPSHVSPAALVHECMTTLASRASERRVELLNEVSPQSLVYADARRLEQMLTNLLDNAIKFNREGGSVTVRHERADGRDRLHVADTGEGISTEHAARIFERFYRVDRARSRALGGTGLGLAIVKHLARAHGGEALVSSTPGEGSTFTIELPTGPER